MNSFLNTRFVFTVMVDNFDLIKSLLWLISGKLKEREVLVDATDLWKEICTDISFDYPSRVCT